MKKLLLAVSLCIMIVSLIGCSTSKKDTSISPETTKKTNTVQSTSNSALSTVTTTGPQAISATNSTQNSITQATDDSSEKKYKSVGNSKYGHFQIPEDFIVFKEEGTAANNDMMQFSTKDSSFIITVTNMKIDIKTAINKLISQMQSDGPSVIATQTKVDNCDATMLYQYFQSKDCKFYIWVIKGTTENKYIAMEYTGDKTNIKDKIIKSYKID